MLAFPTHPSKSATLVPGPLANVSVIHSLHGFSSLASILGNFCISRIVLSTS